MILGGFGSDSGDGVEDLGSVMSLTADEQRRQQWILHFLSFVAFADAAFAASVLPFLPLIPLKEHMSMPMIGALCSTYGFCQLVAGSVLPEIPLSRHLTVRVAAVGQAAAAFVLLLACESEGLGWPGLPDHPSWSDQRYAASEAQLGHYLFLGSALHGVASGLLQGGVTALAYDIPIPLGETELFNPDARTSGILTGIARGWMVGPLCGGIVAVMGGPCL